MGRPDDVDPAIPIQIVLKYSRDDSAGRLTGWPKSNVLPLPQNNCAGMTRAVGEE